MSESSDDIPFLLALMDIPGIGPATIKRLVEAIGGSAKALWNAPNAFLSRHLSEAKRHAFICRWAKGVNENALEKFYAECRQNQTYPIGITDSAYPAYLREISQPPPILYVRGNPSVLLADRVLAFVGTREVSAYGRLVTQRLVEGLMGVQPIIVSGLAAGVDTEAHRMALQMGLPTIAVFGCGLDIIYPSQNRKLADTIVDAGGALVSEYHFGTPPSRTTFPARNRIVAGVSHGVVVVEGDVKSGAMITARLALDEGRTVFAVPGDIFRPGSLGVNTLLKSGAVPVLHPDDIAEDMGWASRKAHSASRMTKMSVDAMMSAAQPQQSELFQQDSDARLSELSEAERVFVNAVSSTAMPIDALQQALGWTSQAVNEMITLMELDGWVVALPGAQIKRA